MGPKKKAGKASKGGRGSGGIIDGVPMTEMPREHLEKYTIRVKDELEREREERNFFQLERDKLRTFWEITRQQLEENKAELRNKDRALEEAEEKHQTELKEFNEKVKHLMYEHQNHLTEVKAENMVALRQAQEEYQKQEAALVEEKEALNAQIVSEQLSHEENVRDIYKKHSEQIYGVREEFLEKIQEMAIRSERRLVKVREYYSTKNRTELAEVEERKNVIIDKLKNGQKEALTEMKNYYSDIVNNNLALISALKEELVELKKEKEDVQIMVRKLTEENKKLSAPLQKAVARVQELEKILEENKKDKSSLKNIHTRYNEVVKKLEDASLERDSLQIQIEKMQFENDELKTKYTTALGEIQMKNGLRTKILEERVAFLEEENDRKEMLLAQTITKANLEPDAVFEANQQIREIMSKRGKKIETLKLELGKAARSHDQMLEDFKEKIVEYNIPVGQLPYKPLKPKLRGVFQNFTRPQSLSSDQTSEEYRPLDL
ncbi:Growth arrest-specific 8 [Nesidiocoris tenuis]|uniref:Dynein regulatory complex subunit 4 n=1 Tax=Nesidiocoris tenuis TaxID=355587 RepID=A0ABN7BEK8_9HEMI|nr:Growth arrest-specific 8 [Nesidiocoris tenuis]